MSGPGHGRPSGGRPDRRGAPPSRRRRTRPALGAAVGLLAALLWTGPAGGQLPAAPGDVAAGGDTTRLRVGLALSGGSARGFAHVGVLRVLEEIGVPVDAVVGTSMGAVVGGLVAAGYDADRLARLARDRDWVSLFTDASRRPSLWPWRPSGSERHQLSVPLRSGRPILPAGLVSGQRITALLARLTWRVHPVEDFSDLPIPFAALATDLETGEAVVLDRGFLPLSIRASLAIPSLFTPVELDGRTLVDGGVARNLPAEDVRRMGVDRVVCSDVTEPPQPADSLDSFLEVLQQVTAYEVERRAAVQRRRHCDVVIRPELEGLGTYSFDRAEAWVARGEAAARNRQARLAALAHRAERGRAGSGRAPVTPGPDSVELVGIRFPDLSGARARRTARLLSLPVPGRTTVERIDREVDRLYEAGSFARVTFRLGAPDGQSGPRERGPPRTGRAAAGREGGSPPRRLLTIYATPEGRSRLGIGARFDTHRQAAALLTADFRGVPTLEGSTQLEARLGEQLQLEARSRLRPPFAPDFLVGLRTGLRRTPLELAAPGEAGRRDVAAEALGADLFLGGLLGARGVAGLEAGIEHFREDPEETVDGPSRAGWLAGVAASLTWDSYRNRGRPRSGLRLDARLEAVGDVAGDGDGLVQAWGDLGARVPLSTRWTGRVRATVGTTGGPAPPLHRAFFLGGAVEDHVAPRRRLTLPGLRPHRLVGEHLQRAEAGLVLRAAPDVRLSAEWVGGATPDRWTLRPSDWIHGFALSVEATTVLGPVRLTLADATGPAGPRVSLDAGGRF